MNIDNTNPVGAIKHNDSRSMIPTTELAGEELVSVEDIPSTAKYKTFKNEFERGRDPELYWLDKYKNDDPDTQSPELKVDVRSLYVHEDILPEMLIKRLYQLKEKKGEGYMANLFSDADFEIGNITDDELERVTDYYHHQTGWKNRLIQGDSLLVMNSLLKREGMAGKVQCIYIDPPYGIRYGSNWQMKLNSRDVKENDESISGEPEMIKAFRDTWELGIHSYLSYLRDRLVLARNLLTQSGSVFVQIGVDNMHLVRNLCDEVFGSENFFATISYQTSGPLGATGLVNVNDYIVWYAKDIDNIKFRKLFLDKSFGEGTMYTRLELADGTRRAMTKEEKQNPLKLPIGSRPYRLSDLFSAGYTESCMYDIEFNGHIYTSNRKSWKTNKTGLENLIKKNRVESTGQTLNFVRYFDDFTISELTTIWGDTTAATDMQYVCQTSSKVIQRCMLMCTDPGDLVLDPTCGSGTTAYVAEQWGRRWITIDTSRIALNIAKKRIMSAIYPYYELFDKENGNIRQGFRYKTVPHITLKALANDLPYDEETLYDQPFEDKKKIRVAGPFTVETLQAYNVQSPESINSGNDDVEESRLFQERIFAHLQASGIRNGDKTQQAVFHNVEAVANPYLNAKGYYTDSNGAERLAYFLIGPKFGTVCKLAVSRAIQEFRTINQTEGASWLVLLGFSFEDNINEKDYNMGAYTVSKVRMHDDLMQDGLLKKDKKAGSFITIGEPDITLVKDNEEFCHIEINGLDIYDPIKDDVKARSVEDIAYWEMDDCYDGCQFIVRSIHFCGGDKKEFAAWRKGLDGLKKSYESTRRNAERTLKLEFSDELWDSLYGFKSEPIEYESGKKIAIRVVSQFGEESSKILKM